MRTSPARNCLVFLVMLVQVLLNGHACSGGQDNPADTDVDVTTGLE